MACLVVVLVAKKQMGVLVGWQVSDGFVWGGVGVGCGWANEFGDEMLGTVNFTVLHTFHMALYSIHYFQIRFTVPRKILAVLRGVPVITITSTKHCTCCRALQQLICAEDGKGG